MNGKSLAMAAACLLALNGTSRAADPPRQSFECDTPPGHFSYWNRTVTGAPIDLSSMLTVNELRKDSKWIPTVLVVLQGGADGSTRFGVHLYTVPKVSDTYFLELVKPGGNEKLGLGFVPSSKEPMPFFIHLDGSGQLHVGLAGLEASTSVGDFKPSSVEFSCSTGDFEFKDFAFGQPAP